MSTPTPPEGRTVLKYKMHWHVLLTHFPISAFLGAFAFMALHVITQDSAYALGAYVSLIGGALVMIPATLTDWITWKRRYRGSAASCS